MPQGKHGTINGPKVLSCLGGVAFSLCFLLAALPTTSRMAASTTAVMHSAGSLLKEAIEDLEWTALGSSNSAVQIHMQRSPRRILFSGEGAGKLQVCPVTQSCCASNQSLAKGWAAFELQACNDRHSYCALTESRIKQRLLCFALLCSRHRLQSAIAPEGTSDKPGRHDAIASLLLAHVA